MAHDASRANRIIVKLPPRTGAAMRLHWVTQLLLLAVMARLWADVIETLHIARVYLGPEANILFAPGVNAPITAYALEAGSQSLIGLVTAAFVEILHRTLKAIRNGELDLGACR
jgi:hypothetical protein